jgi:mediator of RNA polymerase II transcription subunit 6
MNQSESENLCFKDVTWLQHFPLTPETALDYFSQSPFYERSSNNELVKMQTKFSNLSQSCLTEKLQSMKGIEYCLVHSVPPTLFVIRSQERIQPSVAIPISSFYIVDGTIYQSPDLYSIIANRLVINFFVFS